MRVAVLENGEIWTGNGARYGRGEQEINERRAESKNRHIQGNKSKTNKAKGKKKKSQVKDQAGPSGINNRGLR
jgi:hypothetical protein